MNTLTFVLTALVGISIGLLGGGGSILMVPILTYVAHLETRSAIATSLFVVGVTSLISLFNHARKKRVQWRAGLILGLAGMVGAVGGARLGALLPDTVLMLIFALIMVVAGVAMIRGRKEGKTTTKPLPMLLAGLGVGLITGLVGVGGGFLIVPVLTMLAGLPMVSAVGTSLLVITMNSASGFLSAAPDASLEWLVITILTGIAVAGSFLGSWLAPRISNSSLRRGFGVFVLAIAAFVLIQELIL